MIFQLEAKNDRALTSAYEGMVKDLLSFYEINTPVDIPKIFIFSNRKTIESLLATQTALHQVGFSIKGDIYVLDRNSFEKESTHRMPSMENYLSLIKHETSHAFYAMLSDKTYNPRWLWEGVALFTDGSLHVNFKVPERFVEFLSFYDEGGKDIHREAGFVVELLVGERGKAMLIEMIRQLPDTHSENDFLELFKGIYGFELSYESINRLFKGRVKT